MTRALELEVTAVRYQLKYLTIEMLEINLNERMKK